MIHTPLHIEPSSATESPHESERNAVVPHRRSRPRLLNFIVAKVLSFVVAVPTIGFVTNLPPVSEAIAGSVWCRDATEVTRQTSYMAAEQRGTARTALVCHTDDAVTRVSRTQVSLTAWTTAVAIGLAASICFGLLILAAGRRTGRLMLTTALLDRAVR